MNKCKNKSIISYKYITHDKKKEKKKERKKKQNKKTTVSYEKVRKHFSHIRQRELWLIRRFVSLT